MFFLYFLAGVFSGVFGGMGMGGGTLLIPILSIFFGFEQKLSQGINLLSFLLMSLVSIFIHIKNGFVTTKDIFPVVLFGVIFSILGAFFVSYVSADFLKIGFGVFLIVLAIVDFFKVFKK